jgi:hypothetical protein
LSILDDLSKQFYKKRLESSKWTQYHQYNDENFINIIKILKLFAKQDIENGMIIFKQHEKNFTINDTKLIILQIYGNRELAISMIKKYVANYVIDNYTKL